MNLGRVIGRVVATDKVEAVRGYRLMIVEKIEPDEEATGAYVVAADTVQACPGDTVYMTNSREAAQAMVPAFVPVDCAIVGIVDQIDVDENAVRELKEAEEA